MLRIEPFALRTEPLRTDGALEVLLRREFALELALLFQLGDFRNDKPTYASDPLDRANKINLAVLVIKNVNPVTFGLPSKSLTFRIESQAMKIVVPQLRHIVQQHNCASFLFLSSSLNFSPRVSTLT